MKYPKINSLFKRQGAGYTKEELKNLTPEQKANKRKFTNEYACQEFQNVTNWLVTEKINGMNIRIHCKKVMQVEGFKWQISFSGRTDNAQLPPKLLAYMQDHFKPELIGHVFEYADEVI